MDSIHLDGTSMSVEGEYKKEIEEIAQTKPETEENKLEREPEMKAIERLSKSWKYHQIKEIEYIENS
nr:hypothetical protein [Anabaena sphaerica]